MIEANEFYLPEDKSPVKSSTGNYISMEGKRGVISFTPDLFPKTPLGNLTITDDSAEITLYKDTDKCHVQVSNELLAYPVVKFTGVVRPAGE